MAFLEPGQHSHLWDLHSQPPEQHFWSQDSIFSPQSSIFSSVIGIPSSRSCIPRARTAFLIPGHYSELSGWHAQLPDCHSQLLEHNSCLPDWKAPGLAFLAASGIHNWKNPLAIQFLGNNEARRAMQVFLRDETHPAKWGSSSGILRFWGPDSPELPTEPGWNPSWNESNPGKPLMGLPVPALGALDGFRAPFLWIYQCCQQLPPGASG